MRIVRLTRIVEHYSYPDIEDGDSGDRFAQVVETETIPVAINAEFVRCYNPRRDGKPGTRLTFADGHGFPVAENYEEVDRRLDPDQERRGFN